jgi:hypothetical protein
MNEGTTQLNWAYNPLFMHSGLGVSEVTSNTLASIASVASSNNLRHWVTEPLGRQIGLASRTCLLFFLVTSANTKSQSLSVIYFFHSGIYL